MWSKEAIHSLKGHRPRRHTTFSRWEIMIFLEVLHMNQAIHACFRLTMYRRGHRATVRALADKLSSQYITFYLARTALRVHNISLLFVPHSIIHLL